MILVTGGTGLVGSHLLYELVSNNELVRALYRTDASKLKVKKVFTYYSDDAASLFDQIEWFKSDLNDVPSLIEAFCDVDYVYHCAAFISFNPNDFNKLQKINIEGTANIVNLCLSENIKKLCYVSSIAVLGTHLNKQITNEDSQWNSEAVNSVYGITKYDAELEVWRGIQEGLNAVIVNPGVILGPGFWDSGSGQIFSRINKGLRYTTNGTVACIDVLDVVLVMTKLMHSNISNNRFVLVSNNTSYKDLGSEIANALGVKPPKKLLSSIVLQVLWRLDWFKSLVTRSPRLITKSLANTLISHHNYSSDKVKQQLNFKFRRFSKTIEETSLLFKKDYKIF